MFTALFSTTNVATVPEPLLEGANVNGTAFQTIYGWFVKQLSILFPGIPTADLVSKYPHPSICVIGCESTGKSATIENMTKVPLFPTASGICTRCPVKVMMRPLSNSSDQPKYTLFTPKVYTEDGKDDRTLVFTDETYSEIVGHVSEIFQRIHQSSDHGYDTTEIAIIIERPDIVRMDFVDLPGIVSYPPEARDFTVQLSDRYINDPNAFLLCVANATIPRLTTYEPIARIIQANACARTIVVLPMVDKVDARDYPTHIINRVLMSSDELSALSFSACCAVVNRAHSSTCTLQEQTEREQKWFRSQLLDKIQSQIDDDAARGTPSAAKQEAFSMLEKRLGVTELISVSNSHYEKYVKDNWLPRTVKEIDRTIEELHATLAALGDEFHHAEAGDFEKAVHSLWLTMINGLTSLSPSAIAQSVMQTSLERGVLNMRSENIMTHTANCLAAEQQWKDLITTFNPNLLSPPVCIGRFPALLGEMRKIVAEYILEAMEPHQAALHQNLFHVLLAAPQNGTFSSVTGTTLHLFLVKLIESAAFRDAVLTYMCREEVFTEDQHTQKQRAELKAKIKLHRDIREKLQERVLGESDAAESGAWTEDAECVAPKKNPVRRVSRKSSRK